MSARPCPSWNSERPGQQSRKFHEDIVRRYYRHVLRTPALHQLRRDAVRRFRIYKKACPAPRIDEDFTRHPAISVLRKEPFDIVVVAFSDIRIAWLDTAGQPQQRIVVNLLLACDYRGNDGRF